MSLLDCKEGGAGTCRNADLVEVLRLRLREAEGRITALDAEVARLQESGGFWGRAAARALAERDTARRRASARLRAVRRMKRLAREALESAPSMDQGDWV